VVKLGPSKVVPRPEEHRRVKGRKFPSPETVPGYGNISASRNIPALLLGYLKRIGFALPAC